MAKTTKYTRINPNGTYHVPENEIDYLEVKQAPRGGRAIWATFINRLGLYEDLFGDKQIENLSREQRNRLAAYIKTL